MGYLLAGCWRASKTRTIKRQGTGKNQRKLQGQGYVGFRVSRRVVSRECRNGKEDASCNLKWKC